MTIVQDLYDFIDAFAPFSTAEAFDNAGLLVGDGSEQVNTALLTLDITPAVVQEAAALGAQVIISHHPVIFRPLKSVDPHAAPYLLAKLGISAICAHTNLDKAEGGVNTCLAARVGLQNARLIPQNEGDACLLVGELAPIAPLSFAAHVKASLGCDRLRFTNGMREIHRVGLSSGGGYDALQAAAREGCEAFLTGEGKHKVFLEAISLGVTFVDAGHFYTENVVIEPLRARMAAEFPSLRFEISKAFTAPVQFI